MSNINHGLIKIIHSLLNDCNLSIYCAYQDGVQYNTYVSTAPAESNSTELKQHKTSEIDTPIGVLDKDWNIIKQFPPNYDIYIVNPTFYEQLLKDGSIGLGESYMQNKWYTPNLTLVLQALISFSEVDLVKKYAISLIKASPILTLEFLGKSILSLFQHRIFNLQNLQLSKRVAEQHYDLPTILYERMLDPCMQYSCAYWNQKNPKLIEINNPNADNLNEAQQEKIKLITEKLYIEDGMKILEIGAGWGAFAAHLSESFPKSQIVAISLSKEQMKYAQQKYRHLSNVQYLVMDYRDPQLLEMGPFDRIYSVGAFEHFGFSNYTTFFKIVEVLLPPTGIFLLHCITTHHESLYPDKFFDKYIFPGGQLSSIQRIVSNGEVNNLICEDVHCFGLDYAKTLACWQKRFCKSWNNLATTDTLENLALPADEFYRMWNFYLCASQAEFLQRVLNLSQFIFTKFRYQTYVRPCF